MHREQTVWNTKKKRSNNLVSCLEIMSIKTSNGYKLNFKNDIRTVVWTLGHHGDVEKLKADRTSEEIVHALIHTKNIQDLMSNKPAYPSWLLDIYDTELRDMFSMMYKNMKCNLFC